MMLRLERKKQNSDDMIVYVENPMEPTKNV